MEIEPRPMPALPQLFRVGTRMRGDALKNEVRNLEGVYPVSGDSTTRADYNHKGRANVWAAPGVAA